ncbi:MAG: type II toxin-antitoxin system HicA family toxin [candidate division NC10 bacterium]|nr:type II toxin-antitoxin system HicA family toxin [candidate division NC10 bacterium]
MIRALGRIGWYRDHQVGSHVALRHQDISGKKLIIPVHPGQPLKPKVLQQILREAGLTPEDLRDLL